MKMLVIFPAWGRELRRSFAWHPAPIGRAKSLVSCSIAHRPKRWRRRQTSSPEAACREKDGSVQGAGFDTWNTLRATAR